MAKSTELLFRKRYGSNNIILFNSRLDLVEHLLNNNLSSYKLTPEEKADNNAIGKKSNRLQSYISHLLAGTGKRKITDEFIQSISAIIKDKLKEEIDDYDKIIRDVINSIEEINKERPKSKLNIDDSLFQELLTDFQQANYIAIFTSRPIELEANPNEYLLKIRTTTVNAIFNYILAPTHPAKYRYNFPNKTICILFWRKLSYLLIKKIQTEKLELTFKDALDKINIPYKESNDPIIDLKQKVNAFLTYCNNKQWIQVIELFEPVFIIPHVVFNPNELNNSKGFLLLGYKEDGIQLHKWLNHDIQTWQNTVWNVLKERRNNNPIKYIDSMEGNLNDFSIDFK